MKLETNQSDIFVHFFYERNKRSARRLIKMFYSYKGERIISSIS